MLTVRSRRLLREGLPSALYVHGLGGSSQNWSALMPLLDGVVESEALDLPGFGDSRRRTTATTRSRPRRAVVRHLDASGRGPVHLFGNSLGGAVATGRRRRPDLVRTLTLISPRCPRSACSAAPSHGAAGPAGGGDALLAPHPGVVPRAAGPRGDGACDGTQVTPEGFRNAVEEMERRLGLPYFWDAMARSARGIVNAYTVGGQYGLWRQAERVLAPTLLVYGGRDQLVGYRMARRAVRAFRDSRLLTLPDAGHVAMMEYPETVATAFRELLADTRAAETGPRARS